MITNFDFPFYRTVLSTRESGGDYSKNTGNGAFGAFQFIPDTIARVANILGEAVPTIAEFLSSPSKQNLYLDTLAQSDINFINNNGLDKYIGRTITGQGNKITTQINEYGLVAGAHLGGAGNLRNLLVDNIDKHDKYGTYISDYVAYFSQLADQKKKSSHNSVVNTLSDSEIKILISSFRAIEEILGHIKPTIQKLDGK